ncbi:DUF3330 domain-containing protein [uncultured Nitrosomonas sp.]|uniref:DUF3330 domain-containing protein n=1 Tax=uncultured Nitrosomonas sp. TaxID=156424 RepID=UPI0025E5C6B1|nr:DUF3330 domain-containing protein [uncultured Nitrosomonas sp.]
MKQNRSSTTGDSEVIEQDKIVVPEVVSCDVCFKEIPLSEATSVKSTDYIVYYCGLECYDKWKKQEEGSESLKDS